MRIRSSFRSIFHNKDYINFSNMRRPSLLLLPTLFAFTFQIIPFNELPNKSAHQITRDPYVQISSLSSDQIPSLSKQAFMVRVEERDKRLAYTKLNQIYGRAVAILKKFKMVSDEQFLVKSKVKALFLAKRRKWLFSLNFVVAGNAVELGNCERSLARLRILKMNTSLLMVGFSSQSIKIFDAYNNAREMLTRALLKFPNMEIKEVMELQIEGLNSVNQPQFEQQSSGSEESEEGGVELAEIEGNQAQQREISMKVVFRVGEKEEQSSSYSDDDSQSSSENSEETEYCE